MLFISVFAQFFSVFILLSFSPYLITFSQFLLSFSQFLLDDSTCNAPYTIELKSRNFPRNSVFWEEEFFALFRGNVNKEKLDEAFIGEKDFQNRVFMPHEA